MRWTSALAIYALFWALTLFIVLPFHARSNDGAEKVPGQADSAPPSFSFPRAALQVTLLSALLFGLYYWNYVSGFLTFDDINPIPAPPRG
jgi:predicted secreted protein